MIRMPAESTQKNGKVALCQRKANGATAASASRVKWQREGGRGGVLRAIISNISANLSVRPGVASTYTRALGRCWAGFWAVVGLDGLLTYSSGPVAVACCVGWGSTSCPVPHQPRSDPQQQGKWWLLSANGD